MTTDVRAFTQVYLGHVSIANALGEGSVSVVGRSDLRRAFSGWIGLPRDQATATPPSGSP